MGGGSKTTTENQQTTATNTIDPQQLALLQGNYAGAQGRAAGLTPYTGQITAGFSPTQIQAQGMLSGIAANPSYGTNANSAVSGAQGVLGANYNTTVTPQTLAGTDLTPYTNPYQKSVIDATMTQLNQQRGQQGVADNASATAAGAFGGSRQGVQRALTNQFYDQDAASTLAGLNSANFGQAQAAATGDITRNQSAQQDSIGNALAAGGLKLNAAGQVASLNNNALGTATAQAGLLGSVGDMQQQQQQTELTNAYNAYMQGQQLTLAQQQMLNSALGLIPNQQTISGTTSGTNVQKTQGDLFGGLLGAIAGGAKVGSSLYGGG